VISFLVETYAPSSVARADVETRARRAAAELARTGIPVRYVRSIFVPEDEMCLYLFEARSADAVREASERAGIAPERIVEAIE
jgi:Protein of unknown function (DUF4242)